MATQTDKETPHIVVRGGAQNFQQEITAGKHHLVADEPVSVGGGDAGPDPYDYLLTSSWRVHLNDNRLLRAAKSFASGKHHGFTLAFAHSRKRLRGLRD